MNGDVEMRGGLTILLTCAALSWGCSGDAPVSQPDPSATHGWTLVESAPRTPEGSRHDDVFFLDQDRGWIVNTTGSVYRTTDGARTWQLAASHPGILFRTVGFANAQVGWIGNLNHYTASPPDNALWETRDGGTTWSNISNRISGPHPVGICGLWVLDASSIFAVGRWNGPAVFLRSRDGGQTWTSRDMSAYASGLVDVYFRDANNGFVVGGAESEGVAGGRYPLRTLILRTRDGGDTWQQVFLSAPRKTWGWKISFVTPLVAFVSNDGIAGGAVVKTVDGGESWTEVNVGEPETFQGVGFVTADSGWVAADTVVFETTNGGRTWARRKFGTAINRFRFLRNGDGYAVGRELYRFER